MVRPAKPLEKRFLKVMSLWIFGAQERTRTSTTLRSLAPEASASTNSAIWAQMVAGFYERGVALSMLFHEENAKPQLRLVCQGPEG